MKEKDVTNPQSLGSIHGTDPGGIQPGERDPVHANVRTSSARGRHGNGAGKLDPVGDDARVQGILDVLRGPQPAA
jgi:hypothetical protein